MLVLTPAQAWETALADRVRGTDKMDWRARRIGRTAPSSLMSTLDWRAHSRFASTQTRQAAFPGEIPTVSHEFVRGLKCRLCGKSYGKEALNFCTDDFGPLEVEYDYDAVGRALTHSAIAGRPRTMWRYRELLPLDGEPTVGVHVGGTPLVRADRLAKALGVSEL